METISYESVFQKFMLLPPSAKREVADFIECRLQKGKPKKRNIDRSKLLEISVWDDDDIKAVEDAGGG